jgi:hypothetical protein
MCLMCEEQELYDLYLEQLERARLAALGEARAPDANWMWPSFAQPAGAAAAVPAAAAAAPAPRAGSSAFVCDSPGE